VVGNFPECINDFKSLWKGELVKFAGADWAQRAKDNVLWAKDSLSGGSVCLLSPANGDRLFQRIHVFCTGLQLRKVETDVFNSEW